MLKALVEIREADDAKDRAYQSKYAARSGNACKEGPAYKSPAERSGCEQSTPAAQHCQGDADEDAHEDFAFLVDGGPAEVHPRDHQLEEEVSRGTFYRLTVARTMHTKTAMTLNKSGKEAY